MSSQDCQSTLRMDVQDAGAPQGAALDIGVPAEWPAEARLILTSMQAGEGNNSDNRRGGARIAHHVHGALRLFSDPDGSAPWKLYTRDAGARSVGFITPHRLPLGYGGVVELPAADGSIVSAHCTLIRCRQTARGWYEGALSFHRPQWELGGEPEPADPD